MAVEYFNLFYNIVNNKSIELNSGHISRYQKYVSTNLDT